MQPRLGVPARCIAEHGRLVDGVDLKHLLQCFRQIGGAVELPHYFVREKIDDEFFDADDMRLLPIMRRERDEVLDDDLRRPKVKLEHFTIRPIEHLAGKLF